MLESNKLFMDEFNYLLYVRKYSILTRNTEFYVFGVKTNDIFHTMGEMYYRTFEHIERIDFVELNDENRQTKFDFWESEGVTIRRWYDTYKIVDGKPIKI